MSRKAVPSLRKRALARHPSAFLLAAQLLSLVLYAAVDDAAGGRILLSAFGVLVLVLAVWVVNHSPAANWIAWLLAIPAAVLSLLGLFVAPTLVAWGALFEAALYFYTAASLIAYMMGDYRVTVDELFAVGATFTLLAWGFAYLYLVCQTWSPGCIAGGPDPDQPRTFIELLFLSSTNLSATGLSDIVPVTPPGRVVAILEQFTGIGYVAMVVSRLVGLTITHRDRQRDS